MYPLKPHIMERIFSIPVKRSLNPTRRYERPDHVSSIGLLFGIYLAPVIDWCVRCDDHRTGRNDRACFRSYLYRLTAFDFLRLRSTKQSAVKAFDRARRTCQILQRMELRLPWKAETRSKFKIERRLFQFSYLQPGAFCRLPLLLEFFVRVPIWGKQISIHAFKITIDFFFGNNGFNVGNRCGVAFGDQSSALCAVQAFDFAIARVYDI